MRGRVDGEHPWKTSYSDLGISDIPTIMMEGPWRRTLAVNLAIQTPASDGGSSR